MVQTFTFTSLTIRGVKRYFTSHHDDLLRIFIEMADFSIEISTEKLAISIGIRSSFRCSSLFSECFAAHLSIVTHSFTFPSAAFPELAVSKTDEFCNKNEKLCAKNEEFCIKNDGFCRPSHRSHSK